MAVIDQDPQKYAAEIATVCQLRFSEINYVVDATSSGRSAEGNITPDEAGNNILVNVRNVGGVNGETMDLNGRFAHELEHARQFDTGEMAFLRGPKGWSALFYDLTDEARAFTAQLKVSRPGLDGSLLKSLRGSDLGGIVNLLNGMNYNGMRGRMSPSNFKVSDTTPGSILRTPTIWGVVHW